MLDMKSTRRKAAAAVLMLASLSLLPGCSSGSSTSSQGAAEVAGEVPDPCELLSATDTIEPILGTAPGTPKLATEDPAVRKLCLYSTGLFLEIELAENYDRSVAQIREPETGATSQELTGVGEQALLSDYGDGVFQVVALDGDYYVGVTGVIAADQATALASAMLEALDQS